MVQLDIKKEDKTMSDNINIQSQSTDPPAEPLTREEQYLSAIAGVTPSSDIPEKPLTRIEKYLNKIVENGSGGSGFEPTDEQLAAMNSGITSEDVEQISTNKTNISSVQTAIAPTALQRPNIYIDARDKIAIVTGGYAKVGKLCSVQLRFTNSTTFSSQLTLFNQLPKSLVDSDFSLGGNNLVVNCIKLSTYEIVPLVSSRFDTENSIFAPSGLTDGTYLLTFCYITE